MEKLSSRQNAYIRHLRQLASDGDYRREKGEFVCQGITTLSEALSSGAWVSSVLWKERESEVEGLVEAEQYVAATELFDYASFISNGPGPLFTVKMPRCEAEDTIKNAIVLDGVQDPGNVGTVIRTANALGIDAVILTNACADLYNPKTVRSTMGAIFRQRVLCMGVEELPSLGLEIYGAALSDTAEDIRTLRLGNAAVAVGSEGKGLSRELLDICQGQLIIPMEPCSESLNASVAAGIAMWEMIRQKEK